MPAPLTIHLNGSERTFEELCDQAAVADLVRVLGFRADRVALELNGEIVARTMWDHSLLTSGDRVEVVHFVGGGLY